MEEDGKMANKTQAPDSFAITKLDRLCEEVRRRSFCVGMVDMELPLNESAYNHGWGMKLNRQPFLDSSYFN